MNGFDFDNSTLEEKLKEGKARTGTLSLLRLFVFLAMGGSFVLTLSDAPIWGVALGISVAGFIFLIKKYNHQKDQEAIYLSLQQIETSRQKRVARSLAGLKSGSEFLDKNHPFSNDLDLFGEHSLFQLLNHTVSRPGAQALADRMKSSLDLEKAKAYREASTELASKPEFLQAMESIGLAFYSDEKANAGWIKWLNSPEKSNSLIPLLAYIGPLGGLALAVLSYLGVIPGAFLGIWILVGMLFLGMVFKSLKTAAEEIPSRNQLKTYRYWLSVLEAQSFNSSLLIAHQKHFLLAHRKASQLFDQLDSLGLWIQNRINILYIPLNLFFWTDLFLFVRLVSWKSNYGGLVANFPSQLVEWEVLVSLGAFENEVGGKGEVIAVEDGLKAEELAHPLLLPAKAVANDFKMDQNQSIILLTGANMSGKTTFMRTLGINCVLVNLGLKPYAKAFGFGNFQLYTSMRNSDNLGESVSSFYAELSRIKTLIDRIEKGEKIFFLLDEILKGTNTEDRIAGSEALIRQVNATRSLGIISTHDIELSGMEERIDRVKNYSFHSEIHDQKIDFDYTIKPGACPSFNAHKLMELMGIRFQHEK
ncbi:DNA mismatch repair protein [Algoriphagus halophytocola]|uniref:DNA mismatch repair protein n=1 Tax=Algoriphagus halophytocola TaxID=2991499 RepID=A0ABY6MF15_9BACT|nr:MULTISPECIES: DNA mismatch repair protein [unclassified Algoriphagus]UZD21763.1 DNA mismatch repair protein [Algoriphagus sp. TR-M5]WBL42975.1 DNA mismatch repair protein [Algoriphagus sp. TR-M9]